jgi:opacity protein-like surface antigen
LDSFDVMNTTTFVSACASVLLVGALAVPSHAHAQPVPNTGQVAAGIDVGLFLPSDDQFDSSITGGGYFEFYLSPRLGLRTGATAMRPAYTRGNGEQERQIRLGADLIYNWEGGRIHPFVGGGVGWHMMGLYDRDGVKVNDGHNRMGLSVLGGLELFMSREWALKAEGRYQSVGDIPLVDPSGFALTVGMKRYF